MITECCIFCVFVIWPKILAGLLLIRVNRLGSDPKWEVTEKWYLDSLILSVENWVISWISSANMEMILMLFLNYIYWSQNT